MLRDLEMITDDLALHWTRIVYLVFAIFHAVPHRVYAFGGLPKVCVIVFWSPMF